MTQRCYPGCRKVRDRCRITDRNISWIDGEIRATWPEFTSRRYLAHGAGTAEERDQLLAKAEVILGGWPFPIDLRARSPNLKWFHQRPAGASDLWESDVVATTSLGAGNTLAMAEYALAGVMHFAKGLPRAAAGRDAGRFDHRAYHPLLLAGEAMCVVGAGGIGGDVGRLSAALGMRMVGTRSKPPGDAALPEGFSAIGGPDDLDGFLAESDSVAVCCHWTPETDRLFDDARFAQMKPGAILVNVARGELIDETALVAALDADRLRGVVLDVYVGEFEAPPPARLWSDPRVMITPHVSGASDTSRHRAVEIFCENLAAYIAGRPPKNVIDWERGY